MLIVGDRYFGLSEVSLFRKVHNSTAKRVTSTVINCGDINLGLFILFMSLFKIQRDHRVP